MSARVIPVSGHHGFINVSKRPENYGRIGESQSGWILPVSISARRCSDKTTSCSSRLSTACSMSALASACLGVKGPAASCRGGNGRGGAGSTRQHRQGAVERSFTSALWLALVAVHSDGPCGKGHGGQGSRPPGRGIDEMRQ
eukprot:COSAG01_NODE_229_length_21089_cov_575.019194_5_plen_142_part_00